MKRWILVEEKENKTNMNQFYNDLGVRTNHPTLDIPMAQRQKKPKPSKSELLGRQISKIRTMGIKAFKTASIRQAEWENKKKEGKIKFNEYGLPMNW